jgi:LysM repeat protein
MSSHRPSRWLAPLALLAALAAVLMIVSATTGDGEGDSDKGSTSTQERRASGGKKKDRTSTSTNARTSTTPQRKTYTVRPGDTLASISERTGVSVEELEELNPTIDANSLSVGDKIKLTE